MMIPVNPCGLTTQKLLDKLRYLEASPRGNKIALKQKNLDQSKMKP